MIEDEMYEDERIKAIRDATDIVELIGSYFPLRRGRAICPFHQEKTPSFEVSSETQTFKCAGCGVSGNAFAFVMIYESIEFEDAVRMLADRAEIR
jgi:DNA primase